MIEFLDEIKKIHNHHTFESAIETTNLVDALSNAMYEILTNPDRFHRRKRLFNIVCHAANRVIRNYDSAGLVKYNHDDCMHLIRSYYKSKPEYRNYDAPY